MTNAKVDATPIERCPEGHEAEEVVYLTGPELVGKHVEMWQEVRKTGRGWKTRGTVIQYRKRRPGKDRSNYLVRFPPTPHQQTQGLEHFDMWVRRSDIQQVDPPSQRKETEHA